MAFLTFPGHGTLTVTTTANTGAHSWRNSIDLVWDTGVGAPAYSEDVVQAWVSFLKGMQRDDCTITHVALRNWSRGDVPFADQAALWEEVVSIPCKNYGAGTAHPTVSVPLSPPPGEIIVLMAKTVFAGTGRPGHISLRDSVGYESIQATAGGPPVLVSSAIPGFPNECNTWASTELATYCEDNPLPRFCIVHYSKKEGTRFDSAMRAPVFEKLSTHDIGKH